MALNNYHCSCTNSPLQIPVCRHSMYLSEFVHFSWSSSATLVARMCARNRWVLQSVWKHQLFIWSIRCGLGSDHRWNVFKKIGQVDDPKSLQFSAPTRCRNAHGGKGTVGLSTSHNQQYFQNLPALERKVFFETSCYVLERNFEYSVNDYLVQG